MKYQFAAPWVGGITSVNDLFVYTPPGYAADPSRRYPVLYEAPQPFVQWDGAIGVRAALDNLIDSGAIPASIVVFLSLGSGPYPDGECADSFDGREWLDRYVARVVVPWVDAHLRTIASPVARSIFGMSEGGYCAAILTLHHPDLFGTAVALSGYYQAGLGGPSAPAVFGGIASLLAADSPLVVAPRLAGPVRARTAFVLVAERGQWLYGPQQAAFVNVLSRSGYHVDPFWVSMPHGWQQVRAEFASALEQVAQHEVALGVFG